MHNIFVQGKKPKNNWNIISIVTFVMALELVLNLTPVLFDNISLEAQDAHRVLLSFINFVSTLFVSVST